MTDACIDELSPLVFNISQIPHTSDRRSRTKKRLAIWLILIAVGLERLAYYSLIGNLILFLTSNSIRWTSFHSITASLIFYGKIIDWLYFSSL